MDPSWIQFYFSAHCFFNSVPFYYYADCNVISANSTRGSSGFLNPQAFRLTPFFLLIADKTAGILLPDEPNTEVWQFNNFSTLNLTPSSTKCPNMSGRLQGARLSLDRRHRPDTHLGFLWFWLRPHQKQRIQTDLFLPPCNIKPPSALRAGRAIVCVLSLTS